MHLPSAPSDTQILDIIDAWIADLARGDYACAHARTAHDAYYGWTPALLRAVIEGYGSPEPYADGTVYRVTPAAQASGAPHERSVERPASEDGGVPIAEVRHALPLNGAWSDLTATFRVEGTALGATLVLQEIHVF
ncbi:hypothetical protein O3301_26370 [Janthinobacterium sp. SUN211]|uniref:hypothetical protein n=1 Tax=Janthinobacterium sp. SUN211 TaxID=3014786 RepID=UPI002713DA09|nr:hypothetical protein [Janthinobacterium sp. SUN211]MDO8052000.1 hypothetical protein [Janthinobacterium sp. SUN211]